MMALYKILKITHSINPLVIIKVKSHKASVELNEDVKFNMYCENKDQKLLIIITAIIHGTYIAL